MLFSIFQHTHTHTFYFAIQNDLTLHEYLFQQTSRERERFIINNKLYICIQALFSYIMFF
jgi:hypothetical protein